MSKNESIVDWDLLVTESDSENRCSWSAFVADNAEFPDMIAEVKASLDKHQVYTGGGGASPIFTVRRWRAKCAVCGGRGVAGAYCDACDGTGLADLDECADCGKSTAVGTPDPHECPTHDPLAPSNVLQRFEEIGGPTGEAYVSAMRAVADEAIRRANQYQSDLAHEGEIRALQSVADAIFELRAKLQNEPVGARSKNLAACVLETIGSYIASVASDGRYDEDTLEGFTANIKRDLTGSY